VIRRVLHVAKLLAIGLIVGATAIALGHAIAYFVG